MEQWLGVRNSNSILTTKINFQIHTQKTLFINKLNLIPRDKKK